jgi:hypothetical protein
LDAKEDAGPLRAGPRVWRQHANGAARWAGSERGAVAVAYIPGARPPMSGAAMKTCYGCGRRQLDSDKRCSDCGQPLPPIPESDRRPASSGAGEKPTAGCKLLQRLGMEDRIRIYVETGSNKGHQSASVTLARKLIGWFERKNARLVFEFLCNDDDAAGKVRSIIGGATLDGVRVEVTTFGRFFDPARVNFAFSGAVDDPEVTFGRINALCFIGLQPLGWAGGAEIAMGLTKKVILSRSSKQFALPATTEMRFPMPFNRLPFAEKARADAAASPATNAPDRLVSDILDRAEASLTGAAARQVAVCPIYGMGVGQPMEALGDVVWSNVIRALVKIARTPRLPGGVVLLNLSKDLGSSGGLWPGLKRDFARDVLVFDKLVDADDVATCFRRLEDDAIKLCVLTVGGDKDQRTMDRAYRTCRLPPIFEGQGSLTQVLSMGRPFLKYTSRAAVDPHWPSDYLPVPGYEELATEIQRISNIVGERLRPGAPGEAALDELAGLILQMVEPASAGALARFGPAEVPILSAYFAACRRMVLDPAFDRLAWAAEALTRLDPPHEIGLPIDAEPERAVARTG